MNKNLCILVCDDERDMVELISSYLKREQYQVLTAQNGFELLNALNEQPIDLIILDVMMPGMDGFTACKKVREQSDVPILMLTARGHEEDKVNGLKSGADDYVLKPFSPRELLARIEAMLRRSSHLKKNLDYKLTIEELSIDKQGRTVEVNNERVNLTRREYDLLLFLIENRGQVFTREQLHDQIWGIDYDKGTLRTVDTHIKTIRIKLKNGGRFIETVWGVGYKFKESS